jgi:hypothetical protein
VRDGSARRYSPWPWWLWLLAGLVGVILVVFVLVVGPWLFTRQPSHGLTASQELMARNDVRTTLIQALGGLAVAGGLIVTYRTYQQNRAEQDRTYELRQAEQINEFYAKAVAQLGSDQAPIRLGSLYALERLAENNSEQRQSVVDVFCAYLRMPYDMPGEPPAPDALEAEHSRFKERTQELEVRLTAQEILAKHLKPLDKDLFWEDSTINLSGAVLINIEFESCHLLMARFLKARFLGRTIFYDTKFEGDTSFAGAIFDPRTGLYVGEVKWYWSDMGFDKVEFLDGVSFYECNFLGSITFNESAFYKAADFSKAVFTSMPRSRIFSSPERPNVRFHRARIASDAVSGAKWPDGWRASPDPETPGWDRLEQTVV